MKKYASILLLSVVSVVQSVTENKSSIDLNPVLHDLPQYLQENEFRLLKLSLDSFKTAKELLIACDDYNEAARNAPATYNQRNNEVVIRNHSELNKVSDAFIHTSALHTDMTKIYSDEEILRIKADHEEAIRLMDDYEWLPPDSELNKKRYFDTKKRFLEFII